MTLIILGAGMYWFFHGSSNPGTHPIGGGDVLEVFRTKGGSLEIAGLKKTEELRKELGAGSWRGTTASSIRVEASYRYSIDLPREWRIALNEATKTGFVVAPAFEPQLPVSVNSGSLEEKTDSGWGRFDKWDLLQELRKEVSSQLEGKAKSDGYRKLVEGEARKTVEDFVYDWIVKERGWKRDGTSAVKVYFANEADIPFPGSSKLTDFLP